MPTASRVGLLALVLLACSDPAQAQFFPEPLPVFFPEPFPAVIPEPGPVFMPAPPPPPPPAPQFRRGDVNQDGNVDISDVHFLANYNSFGGPAPDCFQTADVNNDNRFNFTLGAILIPKLTAVGQFETVESDLLLLQAWAFRLGAQPSPPFPTVGADPDGDTGACDGYSPSGGGSPNNNWQFEWTFATDVAPGTQVPFYLLATTRSRISGFSLLYRFDRRIVKGVTADFNGSLVPSDQRQALLDSPAVEIRQRDDPSDPNNFGLLAVNVTFGLPIGGGGGGAGALVGGPPALEPMVFRPTQRRISQEILLRVLVDFSAGASLSVDTDVLAPVAYDPLFFGIFNGFFFFPADRNEAIFASAEPTTIRPGGDLFFRGDFNASGSFDIADPMATLSFLFGGSGIVPRCMTQSDANNDGDLNIADALFSLLSVFGTADAPHASTARTCAGPEGLISGLTEFSATADSQCDRGQAPCPAPVGEDTTEWRPAFDASLPD